MKIKAVVFDLGKVLVDFDYGIAARRLAEKSALSGEEIRARLDQSPLLFRYEAAQMTTAEFFAEASRQIGFRGNFEEFTASFADIFAEIPAMTQLHSQLRERGYPTFILSNTNDIAITHVRRNFPFFSRFTDYVLSYERAALKPQARIYEITEEVTGCRAGEILFLDDRAENVETAAARGWKTICHQSSAETAKQVEALITG